MQQQPNVIYTQDVEIDMGISKWLGMAICCGLMSIICPCCELFPAGFSYVTFFASTSERKSVLIIILSIFAFVITLFSLIIWTGLIVTSAVFSFGVGSILLIILIPFIIVLVAIVGIHAASCCTCCVDKLKSKRDDYKRQEEIQMEKMV